jgi:hypothetical protein
VNYNEIAITTQQSQNNYIMSKAGDTIDDFIEDGVTPTPRIHSSKIPPNSISPGTMHFDDIDDEDFK